jgi:DNA-binding XRE family transcriptional regulator
MTADYIAVTLDEDGTPLGELLIPADIIEELPGNEAITQQTVMAYQRLQLAKRLLEQPHFQEAARKEGPKLLQTLARIAAGACAFEILSVWQDAAKQDTEEATYEQELIETGALSKVLTDTTKRLGAMLLESFRETGEDNSIYPWVWQHIIASALETLETQHGAGEITTWAEELLLEQLHDLLNASDVRALTINLLSIRGQDLAKALSEALDIPSRTPAELRELLGLNPYNDLRGSTAARTAIRGTLKKQLQQSKEYIPIISGAPYYALQEIVATKSFDQQDGTPWPTALINNASAKGTAQLRPAAMDENPLMAPDELEAWAKIMWRTRDQLSDLDVDVMDSLAAIYLQQTRKPGEDATTSIDGILTMRGLEPKRGGSGTRGGYRPEQRQEVQAALARIQSIWLNMAEVDAYEKTERGGRRHSLKTIQSRPFVITDRMGQMRIDGYMDVESFIFRPGRVFAHYLHGQGRQTALLNARILNFDPYRETWEKRLGRYLTNLWRIRARKGAYMEPLRTQTLLEVIGQKPNSRRGNWIRERLEKALDALAEREIVNAWQYDRWNEDVTTRRDWFNEWLQATVLIEPPDEIQEHYQQLEQPIKAKALAETNKAASLGTRLKARRQQLGITQLQAAEDLEISQGYYSQLERGKARAKPGVALENRINKWLGTP